MTLACLEAIEETHLERLSIEFGLSCRTVKQDLGILVPLVLIELVGADGLETYRHRESLKNSTRSCPKSFAQRSWVSRYTPHRLTQFGRMRLSDRRLKRPSLEPSRNTTGRSASQADANAGSSSLENVRCFVQSAGPDLDDWNLNAF